MTTTFNIGVLSILLSLLAKASTFHLHSSVSEVNIYGAPDFFLECVPSGGSSDVNNISSITAIVILKEAQQGHWSLVAEIDQHGDTTVTDGDVEVQGLVNDVKDSYLKVVWDRAPVSVAGMYKCDILGFTQEMSPAVFVSPNLIIRKAGASQVLPGGVKVYANKLYNHLTSLTARVKQSLDSLQLWLNDVRTNVQDSLTDIISDQKMKMDNYFAWENSLNQTDDNSTNNWPEGSYGLPAPDTGCPNHAGSQIWTTGYRVHHTYATSAQPNKLPRSPHLKQPIYVDDDSRLMTQHFCIIDDVVEEKWPSGSYCIYRHTTSKCPQDFTEGWIHWDQRSNSPHAGSLPFSLITSTYTRLYYCCRNDSQPTSQISLPVEKSFYLFRFGGECQEVAGMWTSPEFMSFRTYTSGKSTQGGWHPDQGVEEGGLQVTVQLCHYESIISG